jgi:hypothetical protein
MNQKEGSFRPGIKQICATGKAVGDNRLIGSRLGGPFLLTRALLYAATRRSRACRMFSSILSGHQIHSFLDEAFELCRAHSKELLSCGIKTMFPICWPGPRQAFGCAWPCARPLCIRQRPLRVAGPRHFFPRRVLARISELLAKARMSFVARLTFTFTPRSVRSLNAARPIHSIAKVWTPIISTASRPSSASRDPMP